MSKKLLLLLMAGLVCGLAGVSYAASTGAISVTASVITPVASLSLSVTYYNFGTSLQFGTTYQATSAITVTNNGDVDQYFELKYEDTFGEDEWSYDNSGNVMTTASGSDDTAKIGANWGASALEVWTMTGLTTTDGLQSPNVAASGSQGLWFGIWTPPSLSSASNETGKVKVIVTATAN